MAAQARRVVAHPFPTDAPSLRLWAFAVLKAERGQTVAHHRLTPRHLTPSAPCLPCDGTHTHRAGPIAACHLLPAGG